jgi:integration host factor subunit alpha
MDEQSHTSKTLTKADIVDSVHRRIGFSKKDSSEITEKVFEAIKKALERGEHVKLSGFGKFEVRQKRSRRGRNPQTGAEIEISPRKVLSFRPSQILRHALVESKD